MLVELSVSQIETLLSVLDPDLGEESVIISILTKALEKESR